MVPKSREPTVFIVDDDRAVREYVKWLIESVDLPTKTFGTAREFLDAYDMTPGCLVVDVRMPGLSGFDLQAELAARDVKLPIIMMTAYAEVPMAVRALKGGAIDFLEKPFDGQILLDRVRDAIESVKRAWWAEEQQADVASRLKRLTPRQREVLDRLIDGKPSKEIASELGLSPRTVDVHRSRIMQAMGADSLADLFRLILLVRSGKE
jgi:two-component system, LuxR family, response regulator FixJ